MIKVSFDEITDVLLDIFRANSEALPAISPFIVNRDLYGKVSLVFREEIEDYPQTKEAIEKISTLMAEKLGNHCAPSDRIVFFEPSLDSVKIGGVCHSMEEFPSVTVVDRVTCESDWTKIEPEKSGCPRIVFFSIKGGVGRSTATAMVAWALAQGGKKVMVVDLDLESPGLSRSLLSEDKRPRFGVTDWLVEDLVENGDLVFKDMVATSDLSYDGEIYVVPAHGDKPGEYISKLGRVWMPKITPEGKREAWPGRLNRLLLDLESTWEPDVILIDSRSGIDEIASACITDLGAAGILLFALDGDQTWSGYEVLFRHWLKTGVSELIRERLHVVGAMIPDIDKGDYFRELLENSWKIFTDNIYDEIPALSSPENGTTEGIYPFNFDEADETAPHYPWPIRWNRGFSSLKSIHSKITTIDKTQVNGVFGSLVEGVQKILDTGGPQDDRR